MRRKKKILSEDFRENSSLVDNAKNPHPSFVSDPNSSDGVSIRYLDKVFNNSNCCRKSSRIHAVKDFSLQIENRELLAILGHNGAGKSTLINILTGLTSPNSGTASIFGYDINEQMPEIRKILGVCPQHDIL